jgi:outer membrane protein OmpA-like peptidoglycan-associated protein
VANKISAGRLRYKGYGNTSPIGDNITVEGRRRNRRTEVKIVDRIK